VPNQFNVGMDECKAIYRLYPQAIPSAFAVNKLDRAPCVRACPANLSAQGYVQLIKEQKYPEALALIMDRLPLPGTIGRICPHPCETDCRRQEVDEPIAICNLKRFVADSVDWGALPVPEVPKKSQAVAIVGAGPSGLSCAYHLALKGYRAVIFEAAPAAGGWLRYGIPEYRLPRAVLDREVDYIKRCGVEIHYNSPIGGDRTINDLLTRDGFNAVFLGVGAQDSIRLPVPGSEAQGVLWGVEYLKDSASGKKFDFSKKKVVVIGGGNVAMDVARTARRQKAAGVTLICLETREEMPASPWEVEEAEHEGIDMVPRWGVKEINAAGGQVKGLTLKAVARVFDEQGRFAPTYFEDQTTTREADVVIMAIGQRTNLKFITAADGIKLSPRGLIETDPVTKTASREGVFAGGDVETGPWIAIGAVAAGREAAESIDRLLSGQDLKAGRELPLRPIPKEEGRWNRIPEDIQKQHRALMPTLAVEEWLKGFKEINLGYQEEEAVAEAARCINCGICSECMQCVAACQAGAVDHGQKAQTLELNVGSVILAPGFKPFDPRELKTYGYGRYPNVYTSLEFERILSPGGPFHGHVTRRSDGKEPQRIAWVHCVGMRSEREDHHPYCSNFCCMAALKQAIVAREHLGPQLDMALFFMDLRTPRKDFEKYCVNIKEQGARLIRSRVHSIEQVNGNGDLRIRYITEDGEIRNEEFDMAVLSVGGVTTPETIALANRLGVRLSHNRFMDTTCFAPVTTSRAGIFSCGFFNGPKDIPQSVMEGSAAAGAASRGLAAARGRLTREKVYPPEIEVGDEPARVGVFVCNCGLNIGGVADVPAIVEYAKEIPNVAYTQANLFSCSQDAQSQMVEMIKEHNLNRVVVAACSPTTHQPIFQDMLRNAGLNKYLFEMANIRNQCTWVHQNEPGRATEKCQDLIRMAVAKARLLEPLEYLSVPINKTALVVGGGVTGMTAALGLADQGFEVHLAERKGRLGGNALKLHTTWRGGLVGPRLEVLVSRVINHPNITVHYKSIVESVSGVVGNFRSVLSRHQVIDHGIVVLAVGSEPYRPVGQFLYGRNPNVLLSLELDQEIAEESERVMQAQAAAFIQCVGSRIPERPYCSKVCCSHAVENALKLKELNPDMEVYVLYRDIRTYGEREILYQEARRQGVIFLRYRVGEPPLVEEVDGRIKITVFDHILQREVALMVDLLTLATAIIPHQNAPLAELYKIPLNAEGFFNEAHAKIKPVEAATEGIYLAGLCHWPKPLQESVAEALACASRATTVLSKDLLQMESIISTPVDENCDGCAFCVDACPFKAITLLEYMKEGSLKKTVEVNAIQCKGCGSCMATCPKQGIYVAGFTPEQLEAQVDAAMGF
jgi:heterodisulfide reductase subunit A-like polyferredoxin